MSTIVHYLIIYCVVLANSILCDSADELVSVIVIYRHGDRTPIQPYPTDPYRNSSYWPVGFGQLTNRGKLQHFGLGKWLRARYSGFLSDEYSEKEIYVRSTDVDRTLMSAESNLAGLYPPKDAQIWNPAIAWMPIPVHTVPELDDPIISMKKPCPKYNKLLADLFRSEFFANITHHNHDLYAYLTRYSGIAIKSLETLEYLYNTLFIETLYNLTLPEWTRAVYPGKMQKWAELSFATGSYTKELARLKAGLLVNEIVEHFRNATKSDFRKFGVFSGHDTTIANLLNAMGAFQPHCPPYASSILLELRKRNATPTDKFYINIFYRKGDVLENVQVQGCDFNCIFEDFIEILAPVTLNLTEWQRECQLGWMTSFANVQILVLVTISSGMILVLLAVLLLFKVFSLRRSETDGDYMKLPNDEVA